MSTQSVLAAQLFTVRKFTQTAADWRIAPESQGDRLHRRPISGIGPIRMLEVKSSSMTWG